MVMDGLGMAYDFFFFFRSIYIYTIYMVGLYVWNRQLEMQFLFVVNIER